MKIKSKAKEFLFVDGYNIINSWEDLRELSLVSLEDAREALLEIMAEYQHYSGIEIHVVFDAHMVRGNNGTEEDHKGVRVVYTKENELADHYIEKVLDQIGRIKRVRVATSDWVEQQIVLSRGGTRISARELEVEIINERNMVNRRRKKTNLRNDMQLGKIEDQLLEKLKDWNK